MLSEQLHKKVYHLLAYTAVLLKASEVPVTQSNPEIGDPGNFGRQFRSIFEDPFRVGII